LYLLTLQANLPTTKKKFFLSDAQLLRIASRNLKWERADSTIKVTLARGANGSITSPNSKVVLACSTLFSYPVKMKFER